MASKANVRRNVRVSCGAAARADGPRGPVRGACRDLSIGGFFFVGQSFPVGRSLEFAIELPVGRVACVGEVRYQHEYPDGAGVGVRFTRLAQEDLARVQEFVARSGSRSVRG